MQHRNPCYQPQPFLAKLKKAYKLRAKAGVGKHGSGCVLGEFVRTPSSSSDITHLPLCGTEEGRTSGPLKEVFFYGKKGSDGVSAPSMSIRKRKKENKRERKETREEERKTERGEGGGETERNGEERKERKRNSERERKKEQKRKNKTKNERKK